MPACVGFVVGGCWLRGHKTALLAVLSTVSLNLSDSRACKGQMMKIENEVSVESQTKILFLKISKFLVRTLKSP